MKKSIIYTNERLRRGLFLLLLYVFYSIGIVSFSHIHYKDGITIKHSHPCQKNSPQEHSHTNQEYLILGQISNTTSEEVDLTWSLEAFVPDIIDCFDIFTEQVCPQAKFCFLRLRAPPISL